MTPQELEDSLVEYLYDELSPSERERFEAGLPDCPEIAEEVAAHQRTLEVMEGLEDVPVPEGLLDSIMEEAERRAEARVDSAPSFLEQLLAGLLQPATMTLGLFFIVATTGYFMVDQEANAPASDSSLAVKTSPSAAPGAEEPETIPELNEEVVADRPSDEPEAPAPPASEANDEAVAAGTVARLVQLEEREAPSDSEAAGGLLGGASKTGAASSGASGVRQAKTAKKRSRRKSKQLSARPRVAKAARPVNKKRSVLEVMEAPAASSRSSAKEVSRSKESINLGPTTLAEGLKQQRESGSERASYGKARENGKRAASSRSMAKRALPRAQAEEEATAAAPAPRPVRADEAPKSPWQRLEAEAASRKSSRSRAGVWLGAYERYKKQGNTTLARRALDRLAKIPGYEGVAKEKRRALSEPEPASKASKRPAKSKGEPAKKSAPQQRSKGR